MEFIRKHVLPYVMGVLWSMAAAVISLLLLRNLSAIFQWIGSLAGLGEDTIAYGAEILLQLKDARIVTPWTFAFLSGMLLGGVFVLLVHRRSRRILMAVILLIPFVLLFAGLSQVNSIFVFRLLNRLLPLIPALL
ncbi:MAG: hypothetical protein IJO98_03950 [Clostridia bacterium]|nr:hypothetical protein [Clostridia bacterium]